MGLGPDWKQNMLANFLQKKNLYVRSASLIPSMEMCILLTRTYWKVSTFRKWNWIFEIQNWNKQTDRAQRVDEKKQGHSSSYVYFQSYGHWIVKNGWFYVLSAGYSKMLVPVWARHFSASERSYLFLSENTMVYVLRSYHLQNFNV